jgi:DNA topoisomerase-1
VRYTEASLVRKLEELGIGRPSTYAPTISTIQQRGYVVKEDRDGDSRDYQVLSLINGKITEATNTEITGAEKNKLIPTDIGMVVTDFLVKYFEKIMDYNFTAFIEEEFDEIAEGKLIWYEMIDKFYQPFHKKVVDTAEKSQRKSGERKLGLDPKTGKTVYVRIGRYGPLAQLGENNNNAEAGNTEKPRFAALHKDQRLETITLEEALELFKLPRNLGQYEDHEVLVAVGRFGPYVRHRSAFYSIKKGVDDPLDIQLPRAIELIEEKREADRKKVIKTFDKNQELRVLNGRFGPYISYKSENYRIPKGTDPAALSLEDCLQIIEKGKNKSKGRRPGRKRL